MSGNEGRRHEIRRRRAAHPGRKVWDDHVVASGGGSAPDLIYIDLHLVHEVTSPQAFDGLRLSGRPVRRPDLTLATEDHNVPTIDIDRPIADPVSRTQVETCGATAPNSVSGSTRWATSTRASCTSSDRSWASPNRA